MFAIVTLDFVTKYAKLSPSTNGPWPTDDQFCAIVIFILLFSPILFIAVINLLGLIGKKPLD